VSVREVHQVECGSARYRRGNARHGERVASAGDGPAFAGYPVIAAGVLVRGSYRGWRIGLLLDGQGVTVRSFFPHLPDWLG
jgi:hypothetical protein